MMTDGDGARGARTHGTHGAVADGQAGAHPGHMHGDAPGPAVEERGVASGTIASISGATFVLTTELGALTVTTSADTTYHGLSRRQAREAGYQDPSVVNTFAALRVGQRVGVKGERRDDTTLLAERVHIATP